MDRGRIVRTTNIDYFLNCDDLPLEAEPEKVLDVSDIDEEEEPEWDDVDV